MSYGADVDSYTGGADSDTYNLNWYLGATVDQVLDFAPGTGGDVIDIQNLISQLGNYSSGSNPFTDGHLRLHQNGADTELQIDPDGGDDSYTTVLLLKNVTATSVTVANFSPGYAPSGTGLTYSDPNPGGNTLYGTASADTIQGLDGNDNIIAGNGADTLYGGDDNDTLQGQDGGDTLYGGDGNDGL